MTIDVEAIQATPLYAQLDRLAKEATLHVNGERKSYAAWARAVLAICAAVDAARVAENQDEMDAIEAICQRAAAK
jgi:hypothetical protein